MSRDRELLSSWEMTLCFGVYDNFELWLLNLAFKCHFSNENKLSMLIGSESCLGNMWCLRLGCSGSSPWNGVRIRNIWRGAGRKQALNLQVSLQVQCQPWWTPWGLWVQMTLQSILNWALPYWLVMGCVLPTLTPTTEHALGGGGSLQ